MTWSQEELLDYEIRFLARSTIASLNRRVLLHHVYQQYLSGKLYERARVFISPSPLAQFQFALHGVIYDIIEDFRLDSLRPVGSLYNPYGVLRNTSKEFFLFFFVKKIGKLTFRVKSINLVLDFWKNVGLVWSHSRFRDYRLIRRILQSAWLWRRRWSMRKE